MGAISQAILMANGPLVLYMEETAVVEVMEAMLM